MRTKVIQDLDKLYKSIGISLWTKLSIPTLLLMFLVFAISGCESQAETHELPLPQVWNVTVTSIHEAQAVISHAEEDIPPEGSSTSPMTISDFAEETYGDRLIDTITIPAVDLHAAVLPIGWQEIDGEVIWDPPLGGVGWALSSSLPGEGSNIVLHGHNNFYGAEFRHLDQLHSGDRIYLQSGGRLWGYVVRKVEILQETFITPKDRLDHLSYLAPTDEERLTLISCWPIVSNTHRVVVIAGRESAAQDTP